MITPTLNYCHKPQQLMPTMEPEVKIGIVEFDGKLQVIVLIAAHHGHHRQVFLRLGAPLIQTSKPVRMRVL
jgi:hypothetical protein